MQDRAKIFIPFLDRILNYDCKECGYRCCQEGNIVMDVKEKRRVLAHYPFLRYFFTQQTKKTYGLRRFPSCWFLERSGLCYIHKKFGYSFKPFICKLHPFYIAQCNKEYIVLADGCSALCVDRGNKKVTHKSILKNARAAINNDHVLRKIDWPQERLDLEKEVLKGSRMFLNNSDYLNFAAYQIAMAMQDNNIAKIKSGLIESVNLWKSFLEIAKLNLEDRKLTYELTAVTPLLRVKNSYLAQMDEEKVPLALLGLYFYMLLYSAVCKPAPFGSTALTIPSNHPERGRGIRARMSCGRLSIPSIGTLGFSPGAPFLQERKVKTYVETYNKILNEIALGLLYLTKDDLGMRQRTIEDKMHYLRKLQGLHNYKLIHKLKKERAIVD